MPTEVRLTGTAIASLDDLETAHRERILSKLDDVVDFPDHYLDRLSGVPGFKLRVGDFRLVVDWDRETDTIYVVDVFERRRDYRGLAELREVWGTWRE